jgi:hypothetical protein
MFVGSGTLTAADTDVQISIVETNVTFDAFTNNEHNWILMDQSSGDIIDLSVSSVNLSFDNNAVGGPKVTIAGLPSNVSGYNVSLIAPVTIRPQVQKTKALVNHTMSMTVAEFNSGTKLDHCDILRIVSIVADSLEVSKHFDLDDGQRSTHYDIGSIKLKPGNTYPVVSDLTIEYDYFSHSGNAGFFTVDSYTTAVSYEDIPSFNAIELRSAVDFRPRLSDDGSSFVSSVSGASSSICPTPGAQFFTDIQYYLNRIDKIYLDKDGKFGSLKGVSDLNPKEPGVPKDAIVLYKLYVTAYTLVPGEVGIKYLDNKRYTMRDIGKLEKRINNLEYYTTLSLLETDASQKQILNGVGNPRVKNGFLVDSFTSTNIGRVSSPEFRAGIDRSSGTLRPLFSENNIGLSHTHESTAQKTGDLVTLPYTEVSLISQTQSSDTMNINPYDVFNWAGSLSLTPSSDEWKEVVRRPTVTINNDQVYNAMLAQMNESVATGTVWNSWETNWTGSSSTVNSQNFDGWGGWGTQNTTTTITTQNQVRTGVTTTIGTETTTQDLGDRVVDISFIPFMRTRLVRFKCDRLKPNTVVYPFFDGVDVSEWCTQPLEPQEYESLWEDLSVVIELQGITEALSIVTGPTQLKSDANGYISGFFQIPNNEFLSFATGDRTFILNSSPINEDEDNGTFAAARYTARGILETKENVILSTRVPVVQRQSIGDDRVITSTSSVTGRRNFVGYYDPLAQSFVVDTNGGAFVTSVELFFTTKDTNNIPVQIQIRKMDQGIPTQEVVPFADTTVLPSSVNIDGTSTVFTFESPVYLQDGIEYCIVVLANSTDYNVKIAAIGEDDEDGNRISKQPYSGVLFKSQNASTWTPDQNRDMTFKINRAKFSIDQPYSVVLKNKKTAARILDVDPFAFTSGQTNVVVSHPNHGMTEGETVKLEVYNASYSVIGGELVGTASSSVPALMYNVPIADVYQDHTITNVERDRYTITVATAANNSGISGGRYSVATENLAWNTIHPIIQEMTLPNTNTTWEFKGIGPLADNSYEVLGSVPYSPIIVNNNYNSLRPKAVTYSATGETSLEFKGSLVSTMDNVSPVIDLERASVICISNRIDNPFTYSDDIYNKVANYTAETDPVNGSVLAKYLTKTVNLSSTCTTLKLFLDVNMPTSTGVSLYYKSSAESTGYDDLPWVEFVGVGLDNNDNVNIYNEVEYTADLAEFSYFSIKIVFTSQISSVVPSVRNFRAIALA